MSLTVETLALPLQLRPSCLGAARAVVWGQRLLLLDRAVGFPLVLGRLSVGTWRE